MKNILREAHCPIMVVRTEIVTLANWSATAREEMLVESVRISRRDFDAAIFDLDGVLTDTASATRLLGKRFLMRSWRGGHNGMVWPFSHLISKRTTLTMSMGDRATTAFEAF